MDNPKIGELWIHKRNGQVFLVKELWTIDTKRVKSQPPLQQDDLTIVKAIRVRDQYEWDEPLGMFTWEYKRLN